jgi:hypothetical protein
MNFQVLCGKVEELVDASSPTDVLDALGHAAMRKADQCKRDGLLVPRRWWDSFSKQVAALARRFEDNA